MVARQREMGSGSGPRAMDLIRSVNPRFGGGCCKVAEVVGEANKLAKTELVVLPLLLELLGLLIAEAKFSGACVFSRFGLGFSGISGLCMGKTDEPTVTATGNGAGSIGGGEASL